MSDMGINVSIGSVAEASGLSVKTIRFYEDQGLLTPSRSASGQRRYTEHDLRKLRLARRARLLGLGIEEIRQLIEHAFRSGCAEYAITVEATARRRITEVDATIRELQEMRSELETLLQQARKAKATAPENLRVKDCPCCLLMDGSPAPCAPEGAPSWRPRSVTEADLVEVLACDISQRPAGAPGPDELRPFLRSVRRDGGALTVEFDAGVGPLLEAFAAAERRCCSNLGWNVTGSSLTVSGTETQMQEFAEYWATEIGANR